jgi:hypothetical protein
VVQSKNPTQMEIQANLPTAIYENKKRNGQQAYNDMHDNVIIAIRQHFRIMYVIYIYLSTYPSIYLPIYRSTYLSIYLTIYYLIISYDKSKSPKKIACQILTK